MRTFALAAVFAVAITTPAHGDFNQAVTAYQSQQFAVAYAEFRRLAELGDMPSQRNLAAMYARGEHVGKDIVEAWAWAKLANQEGDEYSTKLLAALDKQLSTDEQRTQANARTEELLALFGKQALAERLFPIAKDQNADCSVEIFSSARPIETRAPKYPVRAATAGIEGYACLSFYLSPEGRPIRVRTTKFDASRKGDSQSYDNKAIFVRPVLDVIKDWRFIPPATEALRVIPSAYCMDFKLSGLTPTEMANANKKTETLSMEAESGDPEAMYQLSIHVSLLTHELKKGRREKAQELAHKLLLTSAINGHSEGQYKVATNLLTGNQCEKDTSKGIIWLTFAAQQGHRNAQYLLASRLLHGDGVTQNVEKAVSWLKAASESGHGRARIEYAYYLLRHEPARQHEAMGLLPAEPDVNDLTQLEAAALGRALAGDFAGAVSFQKQAVSIAVDAGFDTTSRSAALTAFQNQQLPDLSATQL